MILHLVDAAVWDAVPAGGSYEPPSLASEGFVHCTGTDEVLLQVANAFYRSLSGEVVALTLDEAKLASETKWEAPAHINAVGPIERDAVVAERRMVRGDGGTYVGYAPR